MSMSGVQASAFQAAGGFPPSASYLLFVGCLGDLELLPGLGHRQSGSVRRGTLCDPHSAALHDSHCFRS